MIVITGAAGFIGSCLVSRLNQQGLFNLVLVDDFSNHEKESNLREKKIEKKVERQRFHEWFEINHKKVSFVFHLGARTDTTLNNKALFNQLNLNYSRIVWELCSKYQKGLVYASSAATYGLGEKGFEDSHELPFNLNPLNDYAISKNEFDKWVVQQKNSPPFWAGLKFFNVYGPNEYHKGRMASVIFHAYNQIRQNGKMKLFRSHNQDYLDGEQIRDFVYVKDVLNVCMFFFQSQTRSGIYNLGTGKGRTFISLVNSIFAALDKQSNITFIDTPEDIRGTYQYFTEADVSKLRSVGYVDDFTDIEQGVDEYVRDYLIPNSHM